MTQETLFAYKPEPVRRNVYYFKAKHGVVTGQRDVGWTEVIKGRYQVIELDAPNHMIGADHVHKFLEHLVEIIG